MAILSTNVLGEGPSRNGGPAMLPNNAPSWLVFMVGSLPETVYGPFATEAERETEIHRLRQDDAHDWAETLLAVIPVYRDGVWLLDVYSVAEEA